MASAELRLIRRRISSVSATQKITRAMELIAASRILRARQRVLRSRPYVSRLIEVIHNVGRDSGGSGHLLSEVREISTVGLVVISSDRGLAGGLQLQFDSHGRAGDQPSCRLGPGNPPVS